MFDTVFFDIRTFNRNKKLAERLGIAYDSVIHKAYKEHLYKCAKEEKSVAKVIFDDVYDKGFVGLSNNPLEVIVFDKETREAKSEEKNRRMRAFETPLELACKAKDRFRVLKEEIFPYVDALAAAAGTSIELDYSIQATQFEFDVNKTGITDGLAGYAWLDLRHGDHSLSTYWLNPKGFGWGSLRR